MNNPSYIGGGGLPVDHNGDCIHPSCDFIPTTAWCEQMLKVPSKDPSETFMSKSNARAIGLEIKRPNFEFNSGIQKPISMSISTNGQKPMFSTFTYPSIVECLSRDKKPEAKFVGVLGRSLNASKSENFWITIFIDSKFPISSF